MGDCVLREEKKAEKRQELVGVCLDCFVEKGLTVTTTKDLCKAAKLQNGGIYYYFSTKEEIVLACAEEAISRIEKAAFAIVFEDISDIQSMMDHLGELEMCIRDRCCLIKHCDPKELQLLFKQSLD